MKNYIIISCLIFISSWVLAQTGTVRGLVYDENGEAAPFATVQIEETGGGTNTDIDGAFTFTLDEGEYTLKVSYVGYDEQKKTISVKAGEVTEAIINLSSGGGIDIGNEVVVTGTVKTNTASAVDNIKSKAAVPIDGISSQTFKKIGASRASDAIKAVTGVSVQGGKYVFVRGLGDRYTKTILNGVDIPGLDPDRNTIQMDIFPSNVIDNILVYKAFSPDLPGDFTGGIVNIKTKEFPTKKTFNISAGFGYNPTMHFNSNAYGAQGSATDIIGLDNGLRDLPIAKDAIIPDPVQGDPQLTTITESFNNDLGVEQVTTPMNYNFSVSGGNQYKIKGATVGFTAALGYRNNTTHFENVQFNTFLKNDNTDVFELDADRVQEGALTSNNVLVNGLVGTAVKFGNERLYNKIKANYLRIQNGESNNGYFRSETIIGNSVELFRDNVEYSQRTIDNVMLEGNHAINKGDIEVDWKIARTASGIYDKDVRVTPLRYDNNEFSVDPSEAGLPERFWRNLEETNDVVRLDVSKKFNIATAEDETEKAKLASKLKAGFINTNKARDYEILSYRVNVRGNQNTLNSPFFTDGDADKVLSTDNTWSVERTTGTYIKGNFEPTNTFSGVQNIMGTYLMGDLVFSKAFRAVVGLRTEWFDHTYTGQNNLGTVRYDNEKIIDVVDFLPAASFVYKVSQDKNDLKLMNFRAAYARTLARPSFKEASIAEIFDAISGRTFIGNIDLVETKIDNFDLRWEYFDKTKQQTLSISGFYKRFQNPIELVAYDATAPNNFQPRNVGNANVLGLEFEGKTKLDFVSALKDFSLGANITLVNAEVTLDEANLVSRQSAARTGEVIETTRPMQGLSPYIINAFLNYDLPEAGIEATMNYNVQGPSLFIVGINTNPDVYQLPFHSLNFRIAKTFGNIKEANGEITDGRQKVSFRVQNILGAQRQKVYQSFNAQDQLFELFVPARTFSVSYSYRLF